jgi:hypothetical protein
MHHVISSEVSTTLGGVPGKIDRVPENLVESLVFHLTNASYNFRGGVALKDL